MTAVEEIDAILRERNMSRRQLALKAGIPPSSLQSAMARGKNITVDMIYKIAAALDVDVYSLMDFDTATEELEKSINSKSPLERRLEFAFNSLNQNGQKKVVNYAEDLAKIEDYQEDYS